MKLKPFSRISLIVVATLLTITIFKPIWRIELEAPQYPEGLVLQIFANKLGGDVDIINGLNHYIGMQTLHSENFIEFSILSYIIGVFAIIALIVGLMGNKKALFILLFSFIGFGIIAMVDFYRWNYNYGHNLDPHAAIVVPGMAYQPPLLGYKQLLNFGAYSVPDIGGWLFIVAGTVLLFLAIIERRNGKMANRKGKSILTAIAMLFLLGSCNNNTPKKIKLNSDHCDFCKMTVVDGKYATQAITNRGKYYVFDDIACMIKFMKENSYLNNANFFVANFNEPSHYINLNNAILLKNETLNSPMGGNIVGLANEKEAQAFRAAYQSTPTLWSELIK